MGKRLKFSSSDCALQKCVERVDLISQLPDEVLARVLSLLTLKEAGATSVLSKRWEHLWKLTNRLDFDAREVVGRIFEYHNLQMLWGCQREKVYKRRLDQVIELLGQDRIKYIKWIDKVLDAHKFSALKEFRVCFRLGKEDKHKIDNWLRFAFSRRIQRLELDLMHNLADFVDFDNIYDLPREPFFQCGSSILKEPSNGGFQCSYVAGFTSLKELILKRVNVSGRVLQFFLSNCPYLERLVVRGSRWLSKLEVSGMSLALRILEISSCYGLHNIKICNTNLTSFKYDGRRDVQLLLYNLPLLVDVFFGWDVAVSMFSSLSSVMPQLERLTLCICKIEEEIALEGLPELSRLKQLVLVSRESESQSFLGFASLVKLCPSLHKFVLQQRRFSHLRMIEGKAKKAPECFRHDSLKVVELAGYYGCWFDIELAMYFIQNAVGLEKLIIDPRKQYIEQGERVLHVNNEEEVARALAKQQLEGKLPSHVTLEIL